MSFYSKKHINSLTELYDELKDDIEDLTQQIKLTNLILGYAYKSKLPKKVKDKIGLPSSNRVCDSDWDSD